MLCARLPPLVSVVDFTKEVTCLARGMVSQLRQERHLFFAEKQVEQ